MMQEAVVSIIGVLVVLISVSFYCMHLLFI